jgi:hypothetical protein
MVPTDSATSRRRRVRSLALILAAAALMLVGCSSTAQPSASPSPSPSADPFAGTWRVDSAEATFVISLERGLYKALAVSPGLSGVTDLGACTRQGSSLSCRVERGETAGDTYRFTLTSDPATLEVAELEKGGSEPARAVAVRLSTSTASPTALPGQ